MVAPIRKHHHEDTSPVTAAEPPPAAETPAPNPEQTPDPVKAKETATIRQRLAEVERAEALQREALAQQQPPLQEPPPQEPQQVPEVPAAVQKWIDGHPQYFDPNDVIAHHELKLATMKCTRDGLTWNDDNYIPSLERHLGLTNGHAQNIPSEIQPISAPLPPQRAAPVRQQVQRQSVPMSAPISREAPSMTSGRPPSDSRMPPLTPEEEAVALASKLSDDEPAHKAIRRYQANKQKLMMMKASGQLQG